MIYSIAIFILLAMFVAKIFEKLKLPNLLGLLMTGMLLGEYSKNYFVNILGYKFLDKLFISNEVIQISEDLRLFALIVILIRAGLGINKESLKKIGIVALKMATIPCILEGSVVAIATHVLLGFPLIVSFCLGFILAAVSPAVVVPEMLNLKEKELGKEKEIPTIILAGASIDDIIAITFFSSFLSLSLGKNINIYKELINIPVSVLFGIVSGVVIGIVLVKFFTKFHMRDTKKVIIFLMIAAILYEVEKTKVFPIASLLGIMTIGFIILEKKQELAKRLSLKFNKLWVFAEILLFVLIGATVNINVIFNSGKVGILIILIGLVGRSLGVFISLHNSNLNVKEKLFCAVAYIPKATVQAAIAGIPLAQGVIHGETILAIGVLAIIVTVPMGVIGIRHTSKKYLS